MSIGYAVLFQSWIFKKGCYCMAQKLMLEVELQSDASRGTSLKNPNIFKYVNLVHPAQKK